MDNIINKINSAKNTIEINFNIAEIFSAFIINIAYFQIIAKSYIYVNILFPIDIINF